MTGRALDAHVILTRRSFQLDVAVRAEPGEVVAIMGPSGAGKSSFLLAIAGLLRLQGGAIRIGEQQVAAAARPRVHVTPARRGAVLLGQDPRLFPHLSARENVAFGMRARGQSRVLARAAADEWLWRVGLPGAGDHRPAELSGGQQQRVALARALAAEPAVLLLDEPLTSLDPETADGIRTVLHEQLTATHTTTLLVTHDAVDAAALARTLVIVEDGALVQGGPVRRVLDAPASRFAASIAGLNRIVGVAQEGTWTGADPLVVIDGVHDETSGTIEDGAAVDAVFPPSAVRLERAEASTWTGALSLTRGQKPTPNEWVARVDRLEQTLAGVRVHTSDPAVAADLPPTAIAALALAPGVPVRVRIDRADVRLHPRAAGDG